MFRELEPTLTGLTIQFHGKLNLYRGRKIIFTVTIDIVPSKVSDILFTITGGYRWVDTSLNLGLKSDPGLKDGYNRYREHSQLDKLYDLSLYWSFLQWKYFKYHRLSLRTLNPIYFSHNSHKKSQKIKINIDQTRVIFWLDDFDVVTTP